MTGVMAGVWLPLQPASLKPSGKAAGQFLANQERNSYEANDKFVGPEFCFGAFGDAG
jgi:hypothetical protein